ncbi:hypothetical protein [Desulfosarcina sp.]|uniref:hypothetical protein n=1 Tax=Desulfosarcina sp. TaxID=2027861 RepID=UPI0029B9E6D8|nr:hypothetical protein [Desulfosarcina sp.]MDX2451279.1 hypothetical protein [Desulfosarcina sp.]
MKLIISHFIAFLIGALGGAFALYWGITYTKQRQQKEASSRLESNCKKVSYLMPKLIKEIKADIKNDESKVVREFVVLPTTKHSFSGSKGRFIYYEDQHKDLREHLHILEGSGFVLDVTSANTPAYRLTDEFIDLLKNEMNSGI